MSSSWKARLKLAGIPSTAFAAIVFACGWLPVSPFASGDLGLVIALCLPALIPVFILLWSVIQQNLVGFNDGRLTDSRPNSRFRWRDVLTARRAVVVGVLAVLVFVSFSLAMYGHRGSPEMVNGELVFTDHGKVIGPATEREADEARTRETRLFSGHLMLFGVVGLLARVRPPTVAPHSQRPRSSSHRVRGRPGGPRQPLT